MTYDDSTAPASQFAGYQMLRMRGPADMAAMLPYLLGFYPDDSLVAVGLHGPQLEQGGAIRLDIPEDPKLWSAVATDFARLLVELSEQRDRRPEAVLLYLCRDPEPDDPTVVATLRPMADHLLRAFRDLDVSVKESLCISGGRWWSFLCADPACCPPGGIPVYSSDEPRAVVAAATYAGLAPRGSRRAIAAALAPIESPEAKAQRAALVRHTALACERVMAEQFGAPTGVSATMELIEKAMAECRSGPPQLDPDRSARIIVGLLDKVTRDRAAEYAEPEELAAAQRLWRHLAQRCVAPYNGYAKAPLTLLAWTSWLARDTATARVALGMALELDPDYMLAALLYESLNANMAPDGLLGIVRGERDRRAIEAAAAENEDAEASSSVPSSTVEPPDVAPGAPAPDGSRIECEVSQLGRERERTSPSAEGSAEPGAPQGGEADGQQPCSSRAFDTAEASGAGRSSLPSAAGAKQGEAAAEQSEQSERSEKGEPGRPAVRPGALPRQRRSGGASPSASPAPRPGGDAPPAARQAGSGWTADRLHRMTRRTPRRAPGCSDGGRKWRGLNGHD